MTHISTVLSTHCTYRTLRPNRPLIILVQTRENNILRNDFGPLRYVCNTLSRAASIGEGRDDVTAILHGKNLQDKRFVRGICKKMEGEVRKQDIA